MIRRRKCLGRVEPLTKWISEPQDKPDILHSSEKFGQGMDHAQIDFLCLPSALASVAVARDTSLQTGRPDRCRRAAARMIVMTSDTGYAAPLQVCRSHTLFSKWSAVKDSSAGGSRCTRERKSVGRASIEASIDIRIMGLACWKKGENKHEGRH